MSKMSLTSWKRAAGLSCLTVYGPFVVMAIYTLLFVSCNHCKTAAWKLLPCAPGLFLVELGRSLLDLPRTGEALWFALAFVASLAALFVLSWLVKRGPRLRWTAVVVALTIFSIAAIGTLAMIRA